MDFETAFIIGFLILSVITFNMVFTAISLWSCAMYEFTAGEFIFHFLGYLIPSIMLVLTLFVFLVTFVTNTKLETHSHTTFLLILPRYHLWCH